MVEPRNCMVKCIPFLRLVIISVELVLGPIVPIIDERR